MFALSVLVNEEQRASIPLFHPLIHVDRAVQVEEAQLEPTGQAQQRQQQQQSEAAEDAELASLSTATARQPATSGASSSLRPSPYPRRSEGASPWPFDEGEEGEEGEEGDGGGEGGSEGEVGGEEFEPISSPSLELAQANFVAGHSHGEVLAGSIGFYRYEQPAGVYGLRPPPLRSNVVCVMAVPTWLSSSDLLHFIGGYTRYARQMRLLRDASISNRHMLLLQFGSPSIAERFRADYHAKRFNSLEPEVALVVHVAQVAFGVPEAKPLTSSGGAADGDASVRIKLHVTPLTLRLSRQSSRQISPKESAAGPSGHPDSETAGGSNSSLERYQSAVDSRLMQLAQMSPAERRGEAQLEQVRQRIESRIINEAFAEDDRLSKLTAAERIDKASRSGDASGASAAAVFDVCEPCEGIGLRRDLSVTLSEADEWANGSAGDGDAPVRLQLWVRDSGKAPVRRSTPSPPPLLPPTAETNAALVRASKGCRATLPALPDSALLGSAVELPSCPVCLERLDPSISGVVTIVCDHTFHCECLRRWSDSSCPVCRHVSDDSQSATACEVCGNTDSLWICLVCGHVGCGRYTGCGSGVHHNAATEHNFAMELATQRVWDYKGDNYVHRLIQNKVDGKLVVLPDARNAGSSGVDGERREMDAAAKEVQQRGLEEQYEAVVHEYSLLLTGQLEVQRLHYEERLAELERAHKRHMWEAEQDLISREDALRRQHDLVERESRASVKRVQSAQKAMTDGNFNKQLNEQLIRNVSAMREQATASEKREGELRGQVTDLEEQLRDMTFHFESQIRILQEGTEGELMGGALGMEEVKTPANARGKRKSKGSGGGGSRS